MRARAGKERSGVRVKTDSETGERHTPHGRVEPASYALCGAHMVRVKISTRLALRTLQNRF